MVYQIAIVEDQIEEFNRLSSYFDRYSCGKQDAFQITRFETGNQFIARYKPVYDIVFMDIMLPGRNGMETAHELRKLDKNVTLIFVTNMAQFAVRGYEVEAFDFIVKPVTYQSFVLKIERVLGKLRNEPRDSFILLNLSEGIKRISPAQIMYVEVTGHKVIYHTTEGDYSLYGSMKAVEEQLNSKVFSRCNNCYLVNLNFVSAIGSSFAAVGNDQLQVSRARRNAFVTQLNEYLGGNI